MNTLKSNINKLIQENKQLLESNKQLKIENKKLRDLIYIAACELETQIQNILAWSKLLLGIRHQEITDIRRHRRRTYITRNV